MITIIIYIFLSLSLLSNDLFIADVTLAMFREFHRYGITAATRFSNFDVYFDSVMPRRSPKNKKL